MKYDPHEELDRQASIRYHNVSADIPTQVTSSISNLLSTPSVKRLLLRGTIGPGLAKQDEEAHVRLSELDHVEMGRAVYVCSRLVVSADLGVGRDQETPPQVVGDPWRCWVLVVEDAGHAGVGVEGHARLVIEVDVDNLAHDW